MHKAWEIKSVPLLTYLAAHIAQQKLLKPKGKRKKIVNDQLNWNKNNVRCFKNSITKSINTHSGWKFGSTEIPIIRNWCPRWRTFFWSFVNWRWRPRWSHIKNPQFALFNMMTRLLIELESQKKQGTKTHVSRKPYQLTRIYIQNKII